MSNQADHDRQSPNTNGFRERLHEIIFEADTFWGAAFDILLLIVIVTSIVAVSLDTVSGIGDHSLDSDPVDNPGKYGKLLYNLSWACTIFFTIEYVLRIYCVRRPTRYIFSFWGIIDLLSFLPDYLLLWGPGNASRGSFAIIRSLRLVRAFRVFKLGWLQSEAEDLGGAIMRSRAKIVVFLTVVMILVTVMGTLMYEVEKFADGKESQFTSIPEGIYWAIVTMTTVGFGDIVPVTITGKILSAVLILIGYSLIIVPTGFVSAEIIGQVSGKTSTRSCPSCVTEGHDADAVYCKYCGDALR